MLAPEEIPTDLALEIDANVTPHQFMIAARAFFGAIEAFSRILVPDHRVPAWHVRIGGGGCLIAAAAAEAMPETLVPAVRDGLDRGVRELMAGNLHEARLPDQALKHLRALSELTEQEPPVPLCLWLGRRPVRLNDEIARVIREEWHTDYRDHGAIEGRLRALEDNGTIQLLLRDDWLTQTVRCHVPERMLPDIAAAFRRKVEVTGLIHYRHGGTPVGIDVETILILPYDDELPSADEVRALLRAAG